MNAVLRKFEQRAIKRGGLCFFSQCDTLQVIEEARRARVPILGLDGVFLDGKKTRPSLDNSVDFTLGSGLQDDVYCTAIDFVKRHENLNLYFEVVFGAEREESNP
jgi:hypothetical protein